MHPGKKFPKPPRTQKLLKRTWKLTTFLLLLCLTASLVSLFISHQNLTACRLSTSSMRLAPDPDGRSQTASRQQLRPSESSVELSCRPDDWTLNPDLPKHEDFPRDVLRTIQAPSFEKRTPALVGIQHLVPLAGGISHPVREFLGKAITVSTRLESGRVASYRGDIHLRIFEREGDLGWHDTHTPSRNELDVLRGILFREDGHEPVMDQLLDEFRGVRPFSKETLADGGMAEERKRLGVVPPNMPAERLVEGPPESRTNGKEGLKDEVAKEDEGTRANNIGDCHTPC